MKLGFKIWLLIIAILLSIVAIFPFSFDDGVKIVTVDQNSTASDMGLLTGQIITAIDGERITNFEDYSRIINLKYPKDDFDLFEEGLTSSLVNKENTKLTFTIDSYDVVLFINEAPKIIVADIPKTRIKTGLDLSGGARALVAPEVEITSAQLNDLISVTSERLNVYGLRDVSIRPVNDLEGNKFMLIEIAGSTPAELESLISEEGKFEAKIGDEVVFSGGNKDITYVARTGDQAGIYTCDNSQGGSVCSFRFAISLSEAAANRHARITNTLTINATNPQYLSKPLDLYLDDVLFDTLFISRDLKGSRTTQISISGSGFGANREEAFDDAEASMKKLQTVLITGSLPFKLRIEKLDTISPLLGKKFINTILIAGLASILGVGLVVLFRYRKIKLSFAVILTSLSEVLIILGISALFSRSLDLPAIAGIIAAIGTGVDSQIIILDESRLNVQSSLNIRIKRALFIIMGTYLTTLFALLPLIWAGAGLLKGFAITTIIGATAGVFITRPAFSEIVKKIVKE